MAHPQQRLFFETVKAVFPWAFRGTRVLDVGSLDINGSARDLFENCEYVGIDVGPGPNVDIVCRGEEYDAPAGSFDVALSGECFEHNERWAETFANMVRLTRPGGLAFFSCATTGRHEHGTSHTSPYDNPLRTTDYYRNLTSDDFMSAMEIDSEFLDYVFLRNTTSRDLYFVGMKRGSHHADMMRVVEKYNEASQG